MLDDLLNGDRNSVHAAQDSSVGPCPMPKATSWLTYARSANQMSKRNTGRKYSQTLTTIRRRMRRSEMVVKAEIKLTILLTAQSLEEAAATLGTADLNNVVAEI